MRMGAASNFAEFEDAWNEVLSALEKIWQRAKIACNANRTMLEDWRKEQETFRDADPLLRYLSQARQTDQHTVHEAMEFQPGQTQIGFVSKPGDTVFIENLVINDGQIHYKGSHPLRVTNRQPQIVLLPVSDRRGTYPPPVEHLGVPLSRRDPVAIADLARQHYAHMLNELEGLISPATGMSNT